MILEVKHHTLLWKVKLLLIPFNNNSLWKHKWKPKQLHVCTFLLWTWKKSCSFSVTVSGIAFVFHAFSWKCEIQKNSIACWEALHVEMLPSSLLLIKMIASVWNPVFCYIYEMLVLHRILQIYCSSVYCYLRSCYWSYVEQMIYYLSCFQVVITN